MAPPLRRLVRIAWRAALRAPYGGEMFVRRLGRQLDLML
jgi:hypothetical protein